MPDVPLTLVILGTPDAAQAALRAELDQSGRVMVVGASGDLHAGLKLVRERRPAVALVLVNGRPLLGFVEALMREAPLPIVALPRTKQLGAEALAAGALEALPPHAGARQVIDAIHLMSTLKVVAGRREERPARAMAFHPPPPGSARPPLVAIGASTGGPAALAELLAQLPADLPAPVLVAQHMPLDYGPTFAEWLATVCRLRVVLGLDQRVTPGTLYLAPSTCDLVLGPGGALSTRLADPKRPVPSVDTLLLSVAQCSGWAPCGVILSGMGADGAAGLLAIRQAGGFTLVQDRRTSVVPSMPEEARARGASELALPPSLLGQEVLQWVRQQAARVAEAVRARVASTHGSP